MQRAISSQGWEVVVVELHLVLAALLGAASLALVDLLATTSGWLAVRVVRCRCGVIGLFLIIIAALELASWGLSLARLLLTESSATSSRTLSRLSLRGTSIAGVIKWSLVFLFIVVIIFFVLCLSSLSLILQVLLNLVFNLVLQVACLLLELSISCLNVGLLLLLELCDRWVEILGRSRRAEEYSAELFDLIEVYAEGLSLICLRLLLIPWLLALLALATADYHDIVLL